MAVTNPNVPYILVVDTDQYAGNFERELTGFCTGQHDGTHGDIEAEKFDEYLEENDLDSDWEARIVTSPDDSGYARVCTVWMTPGRLSNGMGWTYDDNDEAAALDARQRAIDSMISYHASQRAMCERRLAEQDFEEDNGRGWTKEACERTLVGFDASVKRAGEFYKYPAGESVGIFLNNVPSDADMKIFRDRLTEFAANMTSCGRPTGKTLKIKGVRLIKRTVVIEDEEIPI